MSNKTVIVDDEKKPEESISKKVDWSEYEQKAKEIKKPDVSASSIDDFLGESYQNKGVIDTTLSSNGNEEQTPKKRKYKKRSKPDEMFISGEVLTGAMIISLIDLIIPSLIVTANNTIDKNGKKISINDLRLKATQKKELEPIAEELAKQIEIKANPLVIMIVSLISIYGLNFVESKYNI